MLSVMSFFKSIIFGSFRKLERALGLAAIECRESVFGSEPARPFVVMFLILEVLCSFLKYIFSEVLRLKFKHFFALYFQFYIYKIFL